MITFFTCCFAFTCHHNNWNELQQWPLHYSMPSAVELKIACDRRETRQMWRRDMMMKNEGTVCRPSEATQWNRHSYITDDWLHLFLLLSLSLSCPSVDISPLLSCSTIVRSLLIFFGIRSVHCTCTVTHSGQQLSRYEIEISKIFNKWLIYNHEI